MKSKLGMIILIELFIISLVNQEEVIQCFIMVERMLKKIRIISKYNYPNYNNLCNLDVNRPYDGIYLRMGGP